METIHCQILFTFRMFRASTVSQRTRSRPLFSSFIFFSCSCSVLKGSGGIPTWTTLHYVDDGIIRHPFIFRNSPCVQHIKICERHRLLLLIKLTSVCISYTEKERPSPSRGRDRVPTGIDMSEADAIASAGNRTFIFIFKWHTLYFPCKASHYIILKCITTILISHLYRIMSKRRVCFLLKPRRPKLPTFLLIMSAHFP